MALSKELDILVDELIAIARSKGWADHLIELILMLICTTDMVEAVGSSLEATRRTIEFAKQCDTAEDCMREQFKLMGIYELLRKNK